MRTKTLLLTAAITAAGASASMAQVYSVNAVGYVNLAIRSNPAGPTYGTVIANPLNGTNNSFNTVLPLTDPYDGTIIYKYDVASQNYSDAITFFGGGVGWFSPSDLNPTANPGEGLFIFPAGPDPLNVTFVGEVPQGTLSNPLPPASNFSVRSSIVPQSARLGDAVTAGTLQFAAEDGDIVYLFSPASQGFSDAYTYFDGVGWFNPNDADATPNGPNIPVATGFFVQKSNTATKTAWVRTFSVNP
jgi:hypothetical protein